MTMQNSKLTEMTKLLNLIESTGISKIREDIGTLKFQFSPVRNKTEARISVHVNVDSVSPDCRVFVLDALSKLKSFEIDKIGTTNSYTHVSFTRDMSENYLQEEMQEKFKSSMEKTITRALEKELSRLSYVVKNDELISTGKPINKNLGIMDKLMYKIGLKRNGSGLEGA